MRLQFCGVRGSTPASSAAVVRVGGHTSSLAIWPDGSHRPSLLLDAGTGIRAVTGLLAGDPFVGSILLSHLHWDHIQGLPFFGAADRDDASVTVWLPSGGGDDVAADAAAVFARAMSPPFFPIDPGGLRGDWSWRALVAGAHDIEGVEVSVAAIPHKGGLTFGYRLSDGAGSMAYLPDHLVAERRPAARALVAGVDVLVHDAQFRDDEADLAHAYGHCTLGEAVRLAVDGAVGELVLFHHAPDRTDAELNVMLDTARSMVGDSGTAVSLATEGRRIGI